jgi:dihydrolipoamide dehydrogenase
LKKLTIIGGGPAGYAAALYANNFDLEVTLIESDILGGTCLNRGCIPAKYWLHLAELNHEINNASEYGIQIKTSEMDWNKAALKRQDIVSKLVSGIGMLLKSKKVNVINGWGKIENEKSVLVKKEDGSEERVQSDYILLATGSKPRELPSLKFDDDFIINSDTALNWEEPPKDV